MLLRLSLSPRSRPTWVSHRSQRAWTGTNESLNAPCSIQRQRRRKPEQLKHSTLPDPKRVFVCGATVNDLVRHPPVPDGSLTNSGHRLRPRMSGSGRSLWLRFLNGSSFCLSLFWLGFWFLFWWCWLSLRGQSWRWNYRLRLCRWCWLWNVDGKPERIRPGLYCPARSISGKAVAFNLVDTK